MREIAIISTGRTPVGKPRGSITPKLRRLPSMPMRAAAARAGIEPGDMDDVLSAAQ